MKPIALSCEEILSLKPEDIAEQILDVSKWPQFTGFAFIPGIKAAMFEVRTPEVVGSRIRVTNTDGSSHVEELVEWNPNRRLKLRMQEFSPPLSRLASHFEETVEFEQIGAQTKVIRSLELHARSSLTRIVLVALSWFLKKAIAKHLRQLRMQQPAAK
jgi:Polyketide cyclase / dehydrase and lipid transport